MTINKLLLSKYSLYILSAYLLCVMQNSALLPRIGGVRPVLLVAFAVSVSMLENALAGGLFGAFCGLLCDCYGYDPVGYCALMLFLICAVGGLLVESLLRGTLLNSLMFTFAAVLLIQGVSLFFRVVLGGLGDAPLLFLYTVLPSCLYTTAVCVGLYYLAGWIHRRFTPQSV